MPKARGLVVSVCPLYSFQMCHDHFQIHHSQAYCYSVLYNMQLRKHHYMNQGINKKKCRTDVKRLWKQISVLLLTQTANPTFCSFKVWCVYYKFLGFGIICGSCSHALGIGTMRYFCQCKAATNLNA
jgi:hypothetical protein